MWVSAPINFVCVCDGGGGSVFIGLTRDLHFLCACFFYQDRVAQSVDAQTTNSANSSEGAPLETPRRRGGGVYSV